MISINIWLNLKINQDIYYLTFNPKYVISTRSRDSNEIKFISNHFQIRWVDFITEVGHAFNLLGFKMHNISLYHAWFIFVELNQSIFDKLHQETMGQNENDLPKIVLYILKLGGQLWVHPSKKSIIHPYKISTKIEAHPKQNSSKKQILEETLINWMVFIQFNTNQWRWRTSYQTFALNCNLR